MAYYYISDTHHEHANIMRFDKRPWKHVDEMEKDMIKAWNKKVKPDDTVVIIGDFCWGTARAWRRLLPLLNGKKILIIGNHDGKLPGDVKKLFLGVYDYKEIVDGEYRICLSHYPIIAYRHDSDPKTLMFYGHVHDTSEFRAFKKAVQVFKESCLAEGYAYQGNLYNCWCGFYDWAPATLEEILSNPNNH